MPDLTETRPAALQVITAIGDMTLIGRTSPPPPVPPGSIPRAPAYTAPPRPSTARTDYEATRGAWAAREAAVLDRLADAGGDLTAHKAVHLGAEARGLTRPEGDQP